MSLQNTQSNDIRKLKEVVDFYLKRWKIFLISLIVCVGIAILYIFITKPVYQITANILVAEKETSPMSQMQSMVKGFSLSDIVGGSTSIHNEMELIRSFSMFRRVVKDLQLNEEYSTASWLFSTPYYTNSSHLPVEYTTDIFDALDIQDELQTLYTSGTVFHAFLGEKLPDWKSAAALVRKIAENYKLPYYTMSPTYSICKVLRKLLRKVQRNCKYFSLCHLKTDSPYCFYIIFPRDFPQLLSQITDVNPQ